MYRLRYDDLVKLSDRLNIIHKGKIPFNHVQWSAMTLMGIITDNGLFVYICDMNQPHWSDKALDDLAWVISGKWTSAQ